MQEISEIQKSDGAEGFAALGVAAAAQAIRKGEISSEKYASALLQRAHDHADLHSFITIDEAAVLESARAADKERARGESAPLLGVPIAIKDSYLTQGLRTTLGVSTLEKFVPEQDAGIVKTMKEAGGIVFGKNNLVEMSFGLTGNNGSYGQVKNPHSKPHVSGGSSSGAGASVAARLVPAALGGDTIGSIRVPASLCGVVGFKPTTGRWPRDGVAPISHTLDTTGVFARNVEDCILIDEVIVKGEAQGHFDQTNLVGVKLAFAPRQYFELIAPDVEAQFKETVRRLRDAGAEVFEVDLGNDFSSLALTATWNIFFRETQEAVTGFLRQHNIPATFEQIYSGLKPGLKEVWGQLVLKNGPAFLPAEAYEAALVERLEIKRRFDQTFLSSGAEGLIFPTTPCTAPLIDHQEQFFISGQEVSYLVLANHTIPASAAGIPGISLPIGVSKDGLPIGLEIDGQFGRDRSLLHVARRVEAVVCALSSPV
jgi:Asp-tRNA(Asn)/Glu-tRNA(Gln) amidotransferase A subunit family amidase